MALRKWGLALAAASVTAASVAIAAAQATGRPGEMTDARVWVQNRAAGEAIPVSVENTPHVELAGRPEVSLATGTTVNVRGARQQWEYRSVSLAAGSDPAVAVNGLGTDGWEAVGISAASDSRTLILLKRPR